MRGWNPETYARFKPERSAPFFDLLAPVRVASDLRVIDLGCGTGELTRALHERLQARETVGLDSSAEMLASSESWRAEGMRFEQRDLREAAALGVFDLVFSNAALQWLPDHPALLATVARAVAPGGQLAVQVPANHDHFSHRLAHEIAAESPFAKAIGGFVRQVPVLTVEGYRAVLGQLGFEHIDAKLKIYQHRMDSTADVVTWVRGTLLNAYLPRLSKPLQEQYLATYTERLLATEGERRPYIYPYRRILMWATRPG